MSVKLHKKMMGTVRVAFALLAKELKEHHGVTFEPMNSPTKLDSIVRVGGLQFTASQLAESGYSDADTDCNKAYDRLREVTGCPSIADAICATCALSPVATNIKVTVPELPADDDELLQEFIRCVLNQGLGAVVGRMLGKKLSQDTGVDVVVTAIDVSELPNVPTPEPSAS